MALIDLPAISGLFNFGSGEPHSVREMLGLVFKALGKEPTIDLEVMPPAKRSITQFYTHANMHKLRMAGLSLPSTTLEDGIAKYIAHINEPAVV